MLLYVDPIQSRWAEGRQIAIQLGAPYSPRCASPTSNDGKTGIYLARSLLDRSSALRMTFENDILCAEEGDEEIATVTDRPKSESRTAKFEIIVWGLVAS